MDNGVYDEGDGTTDDDGDNGDGATDDDVDVLSVLAALDVVPTF